MADPTPPRSAYWAAPPQSGGGPTGGGGEGAWDGPILEARGVSKCYPRRAGTLRR